MSRAWRGGSTTAWRKARAVVLTRDGYRCQLGLEGCTTRATEVHHVVAREVAGDDPAHLLASCRSCNGKAGDPRQHDPDPRPRTNWSR